MKIKLNVLLSGAALLLAPFSTANAVTLVSWGPSTTYVTANQTSQRTLVSGQATFDMTTPISPISGASYTGGNIYGGVTATGTGGVSNTIRVIDNDATNGGGNDTMLFGKSSSSVLGDQVVGLFLWKQTDFVSGSGVSDTVTLTSLSYTGRVNPGTATGLEARWVIQEGSTYMISSNVTLTGSSATHTTADVSTLSWFSYDPSTSLTSIGGSALTGVSFSGVTATGLYMTATNGAATGGINLAFSAFSATGSFVSAIPEPSTVGTLLGFSSLALVVCSRLKRRRLNPAS